MRMIKVTVIFILLALVLSAEKWQHKSWMDDSVMAQNRPPLSYEEVKKQIKTGSQDPQTKSKTDSSLESQIRGNGIDFDVTEETLKDLRDIGAGQKTLAALSSKKQEDCAPQGNMKKVAGLELKIKGCKLVSTKADCDLEIKNTIGEADNIEVYIAWRQTNNSSYILDPFGHRASLAEVELGGKSSPSYSAGKRFDMSLRGSVTARLIFTGVNYESKSAQSINITVGVSAEGTDRTWQAEQASWLNICFSR